MKSSRPEPLAWCGVTLWLTGLPCAGKTTLAQEVACELRSYGQPVAILDGDSLRQTLCKDLGFTKRDRDQNIARIGAVCKVLNENGITAVAAVVSPYRSARALLRGTIPRFVEIYVRAPLNVCIARDVKGLYAKALAGHLPHFTGVDDPYEEPLSPDILLDTGATNEKECSSLIMRWIKERYLLDDCLVASTASV